MNTEQLTPLTLVVGASTNPERYAFKAITQLRVHKHAVAAFGLRAGTVEDVTIHTELPQNQQIDTVTLYVGPDRQAELIEPLLALNPRRIIFNPGTENAAFEDKARAAGIQTEQACTLVLLATNTY
jgi:predicted CoA-binding protein